MVTWGFFFITSEILELIMRIFSKITSPLLPGNETKEEEKPIVVNGPLSEVYTQALNQIYASTDPVTGESKMLNTSTESQANDNHFLNQVVKVLTQQDPEYTLDVPKTYIWATRLDLITPDSMDELIVNVDEFEHDEDAVRYVLVNDSTTDGGVKEVSIGDHIANSRVIESMEAFVLSKGGIVTNTLVDVFKK